ncbi:MAG: glycoside hydrolase [Spirochaetaceae bacterium]|nr:MAG: glycoside hydrolase [Spirochaetaceae bacterium]
MQSIKATIIIPESQPVEKIPSRFISASIDTSLLVGGLWWEGSTGTRRGLGTERVEPVDLQDVKLRKMASHLQLAYVRIGGTEADQLTYRMKKKHVGRSSEESPEGSYYLDRESWKGVEQFCQDIGAELFMTLNAGPERRKEDDTWRGKNARSLIRYSIKRGKCRTIWELGNEVNAYPFFHGSGISPLRYADAIGKLGMIMEKEGGGLVAGPALVVWPIVGEVLPFLRRFLKGMSSRGYNLDILTWHFYPQQSFRCPIATRRARPYTLLNPRNLDGLGRNARRVRRLCRRYLPAAELWLGETGHAQCGGEPGISDRFISSLWWLDTLGQMALSGHSQVVRQALIGGDYGLINFRTGEPNPDYWATLLWNSLMGEMVYRVKQRGRGSQRLRVYLHSHPLRPKALTLLVINLDRKREGVLQLPSTLSGPEEQFTVTAESLFGSEVYLNGRALALDHKFRLPDLSGLIVRSVGQPEENEGRQVVVRIASGSYGFFVVSTTVPSRTP